MREKSFSVFSDRKRAKRVCDSFAGDVLTSIPSINFNSIRYSWFGKTSTRIDLRKIKINLVKAHWQIVCIQQCFHVFTEIVVYTFHIKSHSLVRSATFPPSICSICLCCFSVFFFYFSFAILVHLALFPISSYLDFVFWMNKKHYSVYHIVYRVYGHG